MTDQDKSNTIRETKAMILGVIIFMTLIGMYVSDFFSGNVSFAIFTISMEALWISVGLIVMLYLSIFMEKVGTMGAFLLFGSLITMVFNPSEIADFAVKNGFYTGLGVLAGIGFVMLVMSLFRQKT